MTKAIFLDKDGTLIPDIPYNVNPELITLETNAIEGLKQLAAQGYLLAVISNQSGVARGLFEGGKLADVETKLQSLLNNEGLDLAAFYYCPHHPEGDQGGFNIDCDCRKPKPGMLLKAATDLNVDLSSSWMIGDILNDVEAGNRAGCKTVLINNGNETEWLEGDFRKPTYICENINQAAQRILAAN
ncbi:HAD family hydrolase [Mucilaginibacter pallidiroseus]|uniref:D,D-heptose 1,7-bisphosphate phosphatase n=1 Tax=Mucilaginibacter pallidiroseus TaxID=2599295 RepID=A0A563UJR0_9SPHI|nr:HAD family hydrolase [Mucilaginibacter pallidiroseus]TWR31539.1 HAD family hydrolase [Mucilaginibacter pallidiroseus]